ncbi:MAG: hypothetical protein WDN46_03360 [Methylocella sp.]
MNMAPRDIREFFEDQEKRESIFYKRPLETLSSGIPILPRYIASEKRIGLQKAMESLGGNFTLSHWPSRPGWPRGPSGSRVGVLIVTFDYDRLREAMLRSYAISTSGALPDEIALFDAVHASTNAPVTYFDAPALVGRKRYWDGAMGAYNNPLMAGVVDAICLGVQPSEIEILSLGTGTVRLIPSDLATADTPPDLTTAKVKPSVLSDIARAAGCITDDPPDAATYTAHIVLGNAPDKVGRIVRLSPLIQPVNRNGAWTYPDSLPQPIFDALSELGMDALEAEEVNLIKELGDAWINHGAQNQPLRMNDDLTLALGDGTYAIGKQRWRAIERA